MKTFCDFSIISCLFLIIASTFCTILQEENNENQRQNGYDCGKFVFTDKMTQDALEFAASVEGARPYVGPLYDKELGYLTWPIVQKDSSLKLVKTTSLYKLWRESIYQIVYDKHGNIIDLIVRTSNSEFAKCWRVRDSEPEPQKYGIEEAKSYYCGHRFISKEDLEKAAGFALNNMDGRHLYPMPYDGHLYSQEPGLMIWPIYRGQEFYRYANVQGSPYYIVIDSKGRLKDVIVKTIHMKYVKCMASLDPGPAHSIAVQNGIIVESPRSGFDCDGVFFDDEDLLVAREMAKNARETKHQNMYPILYLGSPFDFVSYLWPLEPFRKRLMPGRVQPYRLVLNLEFQIVCVAIQSGGIIKKCEKISISGSRLDDNQRDYLCNGVEFTHQMLVSTAKAACMLLGGRKAKYPQKYTGHEFKIPGPYLEFPLIQGKIYTRNAGKHRLVMNYNCIVVGALTTNPKTGKMVKCKTLKHS